MNNLDVYFSCWVQLLRRRSGNAEPDTLDSGTERLQNVRTSIASDRPLGQRMTLKSATPATRPRSPLSYTSTRLNLNALLTSMSAKPLPPLPSLENKLYVEVFSHRSIRHGRYKAHPQYGDSDRLSIMGETAVHYSVVEDLFRSKEKMSSEAIKVSVLIPTANCIWFCLQSQTQDFMDGEEISRYATEYKMIDKIICTPEASPGLQTREVNILICC